MYNGLVNGERSHSWSSALHSKCSMGVKSIEGSNPSLSAKLKEPTKCKVLLVCRFIDKSESLLLICVCIFEFVFNCVSCRGGLR
jgi:hypothetical protein